MEMTQFPYYYAWKNNEKRETLYKRACLVVARGRMNSCLIEFQNGQRECVSRNAVKRCKNNSLMEVMPDLQAKELPEIRWSV